MVRVTGARVRVRPRRRGRGRGLRLARLAQSRAVALGWCPRCHDAVPLDARLRCVDDGKKARDVVLVVAEDLPMTQAWVRSRAGARR